MAEIWGAAIVAVGAIYGANKSAKAGKDAAKSANAGQQMAIDEQRAAREQFQENINPYLEFGQQQLGQLGELNSGDYSGFLTSPDYLAALNMGTQQLDRGATANGNLWGGGADADRIQFGQGLATQYLGNYRNALQYGVNLGQNSAVGAGTMNQGYANNIGGAYGQMGINSGNAAIGGANAWGNAIGQVAGAAGQHFGQRQSSYSQPSGYGAFTPNQGGYGGQLGPSNGQSWNFGGG